MSALSASPRSRPATCTPRTPRSGASAPWVYGAPDERRSRQQNPGQHRRRTARAAEPELLRHGHQRQASPSQHSPKTFETSQKNTKPRQAVPLDSLLVHYPEFKYRLAGTVQENGKYIFIRNLDHSRNGISDKSRRDLDTKELSYDQEKALGPPCTRKCSQRNSAHWSQSAARTGELRI